MSSVEFECLGRSIGFEECYGPDGVISRAIGVKACQNCLMPAYLSLREQVDALETEKNVLLEANQRSEETIVGMNIEMEILREQAEKDALTDILNRRMFDSTLAQHIEEAAPFAILFIDLESFKKVNRREHHVGGDFLLKEAANHLETFFNTTLRRDDIIARIGGDEFGVILNPSREGDLPSKENIKLIKDRLKSSFGELPIVRNYNQKYKDVKPLGMHIGSAIWKHGMSAEDLLRKADPDKKSRRKK